MGINMELGHAFVRVRTSGHVTCPTLWIGTEFFFLGEKTLYGSKKEEVQDRQNGTICILN